MNEIIELFLIGLTCSTVLQPENAAWSAASILALQDHCIWSRLRVKQYLNAVSLLVSIRSGNFQIISSINFLF